MRAAYSRADGPPGVEALRSLLPGADLHPAADAVAALVAVSDGTADTAVVAFEDSVHGLRTDVVDHLVFDADDLWVVEVVDRHDEASGTDAPVTTRYVRVATELRTDVAAPQTLTFVVTSFNRPGSLAETLASFSSRGINVDRLDSRPLAGHLGMYGFLLEFEGTPGDALVREALADTLHATSTIKYLGTFPAASRSWGHVTGREVRGSLLRSQADIVALGDRFTT